MEQEAAECGVLPWHFWKMTPGEVVRRIEGKRKDDRREWERAAWMASCLMQAWVGKDAPSPAELLGDVKEVKT